MLNKTSFKLISLFMLSVLVFTFLPSTKLLLMHSRVQKKYKKVEDIDGDCYSGWIGEDFNQTYSSPNGFSFRFPDDFQLRTQFQTTRFSEARLETDYINIGIDVRQNNKYPLIAEPNNKIPCNLALNAYYRNFESTSLTGGFVYYTHVGISLPSNFLSPLNYPYVNLACSDKKKNQICNLILPQILSTLTFEAN